MRSHLFHMLLYSAIVAVYFAVLLKRNRRDQVKFGGILWLSMVGGALALAWLMMPFPR